MNTWQSTLASLIANKLTITPALSLEDAVEQTKLECLAVQLFAEDKLNEIMNSLVNDPNNFRFQGVPNPLFLTEVFGLKPYFYLISSQGNYKALRALVQDFPQDNSQFILYGTEDVLITIFGTEKDNDVWLNRLTNSQFLVEQIIITETTLFKGHLVAPFERNLPDSFILGEDVNRFITNYHAAEGTLREELVNQRILLGPTLVENINITNRVIAFLMIYVRGKSVQDKNQYVNSLLSMPSVREHLRSVYMCGGRYNVILEITCSNLIELDILTERLQTPIEHRYSVESATHIVASIEKDTLPLFPVRSSDTARNDEITREADNLFGPIKDYILEKQGLKVINDFNQLPLERQLFLAQFFYEIVNFDISYLNEELKPEWEEAIDSLVRGYTSNLIPPIKNAVVALARVVEGMSKDALSRVLDVFYEANYGEAQGQLRMPNSNIATFTLGSFEEIFNSLKKHGLLTVLSLDKSIDDLLRSYRVFNPIRNELAHDPTPFRYRNDFTTFSQEVRQAFNHATYIIRWLYLNIIQIDWKSVVIANATMFFDLIDTEQKPEGVLRLIQEIQNLVHTAPDSINERIELLSSYNQVSLKHVETLYYLCTLLTVNSARKKIKRDHQAKLKKLVQSPDLLNYISPERIASVETWLIAVNESDDLQNVSVIVIIIWYILLSAKIEDFPVVFEQMV